MIDILIEGNIIFQFQKQFYDATHCYIVDFYFKRDNDNPLIIEVDGPSHNNSKEYDKTRTKWLRSKAGCGVLRFTNDEVINNPESVLQKIVCRNVRFHNLESL